jgi:multiple RNA-binding domain-containing protein 1
LKNSHINGSDSSNYDDDNDDSGDEDSVIDLGELIAKQKEAKEQPKTVKMSDMDFLRSKISKNLDKNGDKEDDDEFSENDGDLSDNEDDQMDKKAKKTMKATQSTSKTVENEDKMVMVENNQDGKHENERNSFPEDGADVEEEGEFEEGRLYVRNIPYSCTEDELRALFQPFGTISELHIPLDGDKKAKGYGFVLFLFPEQAKKALHELDGSSFQGRVIHLTKAKKLPTKQPNEFYTIVNGKRLSSFQQKKEEERRKNLNKTDGWNATFVRSDAVVENLAER